MLTVLTLEQRPMPLLGAVRGQILNKIQVPAALQVRLHSLSQPQDQVMNQVWVLVCGQVCWTLHEESL